MTPKQEAFVNQYLIDFNAAAAYRRAGYTASGNAAEVNASRLLRNAQVRAAIDAARQRLSERTEISAERVLSEAWALATADARELTEVRVAACRYCHGAGHRYQRTDGELEHARAEHEARRAAAMEHGKRDPGPFEERGGGGYSRQLAPHPACPACGGDGEPRVVVKDTRNLSARAAAVYAGAKQTRDGLEVKVHSKADAIDKLCRHLGLFGDRLATPAAVLERLKAANTLSEKGAALLDAAACGDITAAQAAHLLAGLGTLAKLGEADALERRVAALEARLSS